MKIEISQVLSIRNAINSLLTAILLSFLSATIYAPAYAHPKKLNGDQIVKVLEGNTAVGDWVGENYRQYFKPDGTTAYLPENGKDSYGAWRVNKTTNTFESSWAENSWVAYKVYNDHKFYMWQDNKGTLHKFIILPGNKLFDK